MAHGHKPRITVWTLERRPERVEIRERQHHTGEIWRRDRQGNIAFECVFHKQCRIVDYAASDLRSLESYPSWQCVSEIADAQLFGSTLKTRRLYARAWQTTERYKGRSGVRFVQRGTVALSHEIAPGQPDRGHFS